MAAEDSFIGSGWSFPPAFERDRGEVHLTSGAEDIHKSLEIIFNTSLGERIMNPQFGCSLQEYIFETMNTSTITFIQNILETAILYHEPRIDAELVEVRPDPPEGKLWIHVEYKVRGTNSRFNFVYPYYLKEATG